MRGAKTEGKKPGPLFPRLHVNDTDKGGPKPPPRNKMALYEQLSIPSERLTDAPAAMLPLPPVCGGTLANSDSSNQGRGLEKTRCSPFQTSLASLHSNVRQGSLSSDGLLNESNGSSVKILIPTTHAGELNDEESVFSSGIYTSFQQCDVTHLKLPSPLKNSVEFKARSLFHPALNSGSSNKQPCLNKESYLGGTTSSRLRSDLVKKPETSTSADEESEAKLKSLDEGHLKLYEAGQGHDKNICSLPQASQDNGKNTTTVVKARDNISPAISLNPIIGEKHPERTSQMPMSSNIPQKGCDVNESRTSETRGRIDMQPNKMSVGDADADADATRQANISAINTAGVSRIDPCHETPLAYSHTGPLNSVQNGHRHEDEDESSPLPASFVNRKEDPTSNVVSRDDVVEMIGHKQFWQVRQAIINQQRVFSMQVFELHRIVKVQRIVAGSRHLLMEESLFLREAISKPSSLKEPTHNLVPENSPLLVKLDDIAPKIKVASADNPFQNQPHTLLNDDFTAGIPKIGHKFGKLPMWGLPPSVGNQWLVPIMSPSEGLIYKPYTEPPCPPLGGYLPTFYSACGTNLPVAPSIGPTYFPLYGIPAMSPSVPGPTIEHISAKVDSKDKDRDMCSIYQNSCIVASERIVSETLLSKDVEKLETKDIIPRKRIPEDALPLFPTVPTGYGSVQPVVSTHNNEHKTQVIKVIPHNPKLASESAARIIQLIQEERKHLCN